MQCLYVLFKSSHINVFEVALESTGEWITHISGIFEPISTKFHRESHLSMPKAYTRERSWPISNDDFIPIFARYPPCFLTSFSSLNFPTSSPLQFLSESLEIWCEGTFHESTNFCRWKFFVTSKVKVTEASKFFFLIDCESHKYESMWMKFEHSM